MNTQQDTSAAARAAGTVAIGGALTGNRMGFGVMQAEGHLVELERVRAK